MVYDPQLEIKFRRFENRIVELEKAADAQDRALIQLAENMGVKIDLAQTPTTEVASERKQEEKTVKDPRESEEILALLRKSEQRDAQ